MKIFQFLKSRWFHRSLLLVLLTITTSGVLFFTWIFLQIQSLPKVNPLALNTYETTKIYDVNNRVIWQPTNTHIIPLAKDNIPKLYQNSLIAVEDSNFWTNKGYSTKGIFNMAYTTIAAKLNPNIIARGGSTIEQQLIKNVFFDGGNNVKTTTRKVQEIYLAQQLDHNFSKQQILTYYINNLNFAEGDKGVGAAMMTYFGKTPDDYKANTVENIAQQAYLAGLGQNPTIYNLYTNPKLANERKNVVLNIMRQHHLITKSQYQEAVKYKLTSDLKPRFWEAELQRKRNLKYQVYTDGVVNQVEKLGYNLDDLSIQIHTFLNPKTFNHITNMVRDNKYYQDGSVGKEQGAATIINHNGIVEGMVGSRHANDEYNRAIQRTRSSGSSMKPFTAYGPLLQYFGSQYNTTSTFSSADYLYPGTNRYMHNWGNYTYGNVDIQKALRLSINTVVARIDDDVLGSTRMKTFLSGVGLDTKSSYSAVDGIGLNISTLDAAAAWNTLNNGGIYTEPRFVNYLQFSDGSKKSIPANRHRAMNASTAYVLTQMLRGVVTQGYTGASGAISKYQGYAAKTGTVGLDSSSQATDTYGEGGSDAWFDSITNGGYAIALWFGYDNPNHSPQIADNFNGSEQLGRDLQLSLTGNQKSLPNWKQPTNVSYLGGSGINRNYAVTDSHDLQGKKSISVTKVNHAYQQLGQIKVTKPKVSIDANWPKQIASNYQPFYQLYAKQNQLLNQPEVINNQIYQVLKSKGE